MRQFLFIFLLGCAVLLSGCSLISKGEYFTADLGGENSLVKRADWLTDTSEPSFGKFRPPLRKVVFGESKKTSFIVYPIIVNEKAISFGPLFLPLIPVLNGWQDPPSQYASKVRLLFKGACGDVEGLKISVNGKPVSTEVLNNKDGTFFILTDVLKNIEGEVFVRVELEGDSRPFVFKKEKTFCFVPFTSFN